MGVETSERISFLDLAERVIDHVRRPMTIEEIWATGEELALTSRLNTMGRTPAVTLGARLYTDVKKPTSRFCTVGSGPATFLLKALTGAIPALSGPTTAAFEHTTRVSVSERQLHPLLVWFVDREFGVHCRTIFHEKSTSGGPKHNQWVHPDVVGFALTKKDWATTEVIQLANLTGSPNVRLYSFELKIALSFPTLRESFFQAVSNSSWAHEAYLVAVEIDPDPEFRAELSRLSQAFGVGVIQLSLRQPEDSEVILVAREKTEIDWKTVDRIAHVNPDFDDFIRAVLKSVTINQDVLRGDPVLADSELEQHLKPIVPALTD